MVTATAIKMSIYGKMIQTTRKDKLALEKRLKERKEKFDKEKFNYEAESKEIITQIRKLEELERAIAGVSGENKESSGEIPVPSFDIQVPDGGIKDINESSDPKEVKEPSYQTQYARTKPFFQKMEAEIVGCLNATPFTTLRSWRIAAEVAKSRPELVEAGMDRFQNQINRCCVILAKEGKIKKTSWGRYSSI